MSLLFDRYVAANVGGLLIKDLRMSFRAEHTLSSDPNTLTLTITNLSATNRNQMGEDELRLSLEVGYNGTSEIVFIGDVDRVRHVWEGPDTHTLIECGDGSAGLRKASIAVALKEGTKVLDAIKKVGKQMLVDMGGLDDLRDSDFARSIDQYANGHSLFGRSKDIMDDLSRTAGLEWRVQDGVLEVNKRNTPIGDTAVLLAPETGLIGSPEPGEKGKVSVRSLIQPGLKPARKVKIQSEHLEGFYRITKSIYSGDTHGTDWYIDLEVSPL